MNFRLKNQNDIFCDVPDKNFNFTVLFFYPKDNTPGCTVEVSEFSSLMDEFEKSGARVFGISGLDTKSKKKFVEKTNCKIDLLADEDFRVSREFGFYRQKSFMGKKYWGIERSTVILDSSGRVVQTFKNVKPHGHAKEVLMCLKQHLLG
ncbi:MAG: peroxiredoxin [Deltaproteobacteria bacterium]|nr:peroxiredoxin [Deltaproteobacteria bacterium]